MLFDLNLICGDSTCDQGESRMMLMEEEKLLEGSGTLIDDSGTSLSSIINADGEEDSNSNTTSPVFTFDILNTGGRRDGIQKAAPESVTKDLSQENGDDKGGGIVWEFSSGSSPMKPQWLNLSLADSGDVGGSDLGVVQKVRKSRRGPRSRSSQFRGVTFYRRTGRWESHIWDCGKQVYLGGFDTALAAARAYDRAAIKFRGIDADINFDTSDYDEDMKQMKHLSKEEFVHILRRRSNGFARGSSKYRGVTLHKCGRWEARMGQLLGKKYMYLGLFDNEVQAARAYDKAAIQCIGREALTNFEPSTYEGKITFESNDGGKGGNLDLSLGISTPSQKGNGAVGHCQFRSADLSIREKALVENSSSADAGEVTYSSLAMAAKHPSAPSGLSSYFSLDDEGIAKKKKAEADPVPRFSNWTWRMQGHGAMSMAPPWSFLSAAASSGFSSSPISTSSATLPLLLHHPNNITARDMPY